MPQCDYFILYYKGKYLCAFSIFSFNFNIKECMIIIHVLFKFTLTSRLIHHPHMSLGGYYVSKINTNFEKLIFHPTLSLASKKLVHFTMCGNDIFLTVRSPRAVFSLLLVYGKKIGVFNYQATWNA